MSDWVVIDTNVAILAKLTEGSLECRWACSNYLSQPEVLCICLDEQSKIMDEYAKHLSFSGQPTIGDMFFKFLYDNQHNSQRIKRVSINCLNEDCTEISSDDDVVNQLTDRSDRKFLAVALQAKAAIVNATDGDWLENKPLLDLLGVEVRQLCG
jgi:predicted nucleic acid-binding protein